MTTEKADLLFASVPFRLMAGLQIPLYRRIAEHDAEFYARLGKSGFLLDFGEDGSGLMMKALRTGSGYYIDVGASDLIAAGEIKLKTGVEPKELQPGSVVLSDGSALPADVIIYATGYQPMTARVAQIVSQEAADRIGPTGATGPAPVAIPAPGSASCATCGSRSRIRRCGFTAAISRCRGTIRSTLRCSSRRAWRGCRRRSTPRPSGRCLRRHCRRPAAFTTTAVVAVIGPR